VTASMSWAWQKREVTKKGDDKLKYHHVGIPSKVPREGEIFLAEYKIYATDDQSNPYGIQWMRYLPDCPLPEVVKTVSHVAFEVDDLEQAIRGKRVIIEPNSPSPGVRVAFILEDGAPVEFLEFEKKIKINHDSGKEYQTVRAGFGRERDI
jgi:hypothetical protein